ncbi:uncharacterized protein LOC130655610 [Hydractinia symbiolongicarpus]|uniref:uncharacterized protein LOC130655610 n=1 Tax=Hydractinia symbiolongicarpus TaxID=13093 RepID=UPI00254C5CD0|nr:uncharacterized protein LOC130655610 [Hydractinia symbiolongicarpus]
MSKEAVESSLKSSYSLWTSTPQLVSIKTANKSATQISGERSWIETMKRDTKSFSYFQTNSVSIYGGCLKHHHWLSSPEIVPSNDNSSIDASKKSPSQAKGYL